MLRAEDAINSGSLSVQVKESYRKGAVGRRFMFYFWIGMLVALLIALGAVVWLMRQAAMGFDNSLRG